MKLPNLDKKIFFDFYKKICYNIYRKLKNIKILGEQQPWPVFN